MTAKRVLVVGCNGLLGQKVARRLLENPNVTVMGASVEPELLFDAPLPYHQMDITREEAVNRLVSNCAPDAIVNAAAYTNVDRAEIEKTLCWEINVVGVENLARVARDIGARFYHISTDYVFSGENGSYSEEDEPAPRGFYARSKLTAEWVLEAFGVPSFIARTSTLFGLGEHVRPNFVTWLISALQARKAVTIVTDQISNPTLADNLAEVLAVAIEKEAEGIYHVTGSEALSRYAFALKIAEVFDLNPALIRKGKTADLKQLAPRPLNAALRVDKVQRDLGVHLFTVKEALRELKKQIEMNS